jgi:hypothetical protein
MKTPSSLRYLWAPLLVLACSPAAFSQTIDFSFLDGSVTATGSVFVSDGLATSGTITVSGDAPLDSTYSLVSPVPTSGSVRDSLGGGGDDMIFDNVVNSTENYLTGNGLGFAIGYDSAGHVQAFANLWENSPNNYELYLAGNAGSGYAFQIYTGTGNLTVVPESSAYAVLAGVFALAFAYFRRRPMLV